MVGCDIYSGFRGNTEHTNLVYVNWDRGQFMDGHPWVGGDFWVIHNMEDKMNHLSPSNPVVPTNSSTHIPLNCDFGAFIARYLKKLSPGQDRMYWRPAFGAQLVRFHKTIIHRQFSCLISLLAGTPSTS